MSSPTNTLLNFSVWLVVTMILTMMMLLTSMLMKTYLGILMFSFDTEMMPLELSLSNMNLMFLKMVTMISLLIFLWSLYYMSNHKGTLFYYSLLFFVVSMLLLTLSNSMFMIFLGWEGLGITSFVLIIFYQNWMSAKGGLLTLLTNRLGDAILLITLCGYLNIMSGLMENKNSSMFLFSIFVLLTLTKSAQWPFVSWLPAAMAAPTPVSSLVHSSTLVTAGVWLLVRFSSNTSFNILVWGFLGTLTLLVASLSALLETDAKKMVALSTLSQLGLMFISLAMSMPSICFFHILMHALAKANLFMVIGSLLHSSFSQQDARLISSSVLGSMMFISMLISIVSLIGLTFTAGFYSKEQILMGQYSLMNSMTSNVLVFLITGLTLAYCLKLLMSVFNLNSQSVFQHPMTSKTGFSPIFLMSALSMISGFMFYVNMAPCSLILSSLESIYWAMSILGVMMLTISTLYLTKSYYGFYSQLKLIDLILKSIKKIKSMTTNMESSGSEMMFLTTSYIMMNFMKQSIRLIFLFALVNILFISF